MVPASNSKVELTSLRNQPKASYMQRLMVLRASLRSYKSRRAARENFGKRIMTKKNYRRISSPMLDVVRRERGRFSIWYFRCSVPLGPTAPPD